MLTYRILFSLASLYNIAFGIWTAMYPDAFFRWYDLHQPQYPGIWACFGMGTGFYGLLYAYAAWKPNSADAIIAVGLLGKLLGPIGWLLCVARQELPPTTFPLTLTHDLIWWFPFAFYLLRQSRARDTILIGFAVLVHLIACSGLLWIAPSTEANADLAGRWRWASEHVTPWTVTWLCWTISSMSLLAVLILWSQHIYRRGASTRAVLSGCAVPAVGLLCDVIGEMIMIRGNAGLGTTQEEFAAVVTTYRWLGPVSANGLYCIGGLMLSTVAWQTGSLRGPWGILGFALWIVGIVLTVAAIVNHRTLMVGSGAAVMLLFLAWASGLAWHMNSGSKSREPGN